ncbi:GbsR/MarR family transcriptional regulator [Pullulanibacillus sp. KACC 23026]|uniref:GbsR/MarR family transcriptional regulator n=1 Tax=Pullulanibacillus sp. KACC 23026 TaxID=3028315 RepID=UPI0023AF2362|nr:GbsR/MarR family transcriptional regulator [Pullulanibacillus sp. KACC 23026]WEG12064.1 GbsR/MarR family transcriptional regulator [Pullulanibacillus sp. KACC 23026]
MSNSSQSKIDEQIDRARERVIETISQNMHLYGVTPSIGRLYGILFFNEEPLTLDNMKEELKMSKTSMSTSVRTLTDLNMVEKVWRKGERKDLYTAKKDWYDIFIHYFSNEWRKVVQINVSAINESLNELDSLLTNEDLLTDQQRDVISKDREKLLYSKEYYEWLTRLFDFFESDEIFKAVQRLDQEKKN